MICQERFSDLPDYPFSRLRTLLDKVNPGETPIDFSVGEPKHSIPPFVPAGMMKNIDSLNRYPPNFGSEELLEAISGWLTKRYGIDPPNPNTELVALNGSREGIFNATIALCNEKDTLEKPIVLIPNPFYQCYLAAAVAANAKPFFVPANSTNNFLPDFTEVSKKLLNRTSILFICSPSNPQGAVADISYWKGLLELAEVYGFKIFSDECYSEIYRGKKPVGILQASSALGHDPEKVLSFNSLSKRSNLPGLRSGFVCGGQRSMNSIKKLRSYGGAPLPFPIQEISRLAWSDEKHVEKNRNLYRQKYEIADKIFFTLEDYKAPEAGFFLWLKTEDGEKLTFSLWKNFGIKCLPGSYLTHQGKNQVHSGNSSSDFVRIALVHSLARTTEGLVRIAKALEVNINELLINSH